MSSLNGSFDARPEPPTDDPALENDGRYATACAHAVAGEFPAALRLFEDLLTGLKEKPARAIVENDLGTMAAASGDFTTARQRFQGALALDAGCRAARENLTLLDGSLVNGNSHEFCDRSLDNGNSHEFCYCDRALPQSLSETRPARVAILSLLFNWPSTGGGTVHTAELGKFLGRAGYEVRHIYACFPDWGLGNVSQPTGAPSVPLVFNASSWNANSIQSRFREAVDGFAPDYVIITDTWNFKPLLAEAVRGYRYFLRLAAMECLCPLNNVRLLIGEQGEISACPRQQLATPDVCRECVAARGHQSGGLHQAERALSGFGSAGYAGQLLRAFSEAEGVLVVNPLIGAMVAPFANAVHVVPSGFDPARFPWPWPNQSAGQRPEPRLTRLFFAGLVAEYMKGFHVLHAACERLWQKRQDFELVATADPPSRVGFQPAASVQVDEFTHYIGWLSQAVLPAHIRQADVLMFPTIAEEALGRTAVEAMGVGRPVIASRIGGLPFTVTEGLTGLLAEPGNIDDLAEKIETLLDHPELRQRMGEAGRQ